MPFNIGVVIVCAGKGKRLSKTKDKAVLEIKGKPLFYHTFKIFKNIKKIKEIIVVMREKNFSLARKLMKDKRVKLVRGGKERKDSVYNGLKALSENINYVLIHDGARPFIKKRIVFEMIEALKKYPAVICGVKPKDTVKSTEGNYAQKTLNRENLFLVQTPQGFRKDLILKGYVRLKAKNVFDDAQVLEFLGRKAEIIEGDIFNIKITYPEDLVLAKAILKSRE
jgi:2-C-methyl-D-erythritol 4-phosphate cytidylyltransferase